MVAAIGTTRKCNDLRKLNGDKALDLGDRVRRQFLRDLGDDTLGNLGMKGLAKITEYFRRRDDDELLETIGVSMAIESLRQLGGKPLLGYMMPIGFFHCASGNPKAYDGAPRTIRALQTAGWIVTLEDLLDDQRDTLRVAFVPQEKSFLAITDENESIVGDAQFRFRGHFADAPDPLVVMKILSRFKKQMLPE